MKYCPTVLVLAKTQRRHQVAAEAMPLTLDMGWLDPTSSRVNRCIEAKRLSLRALEPEWVRPP